MSTAEGRQPESPDLMTRFNKWAATVVSAVSLLSLFGANLDLGPLAHSLMENYRRIREFVWQPFSVFIEIDPGLKDLFTFTGIFLVAFLLRGDRRNNFAAICMLGSIVGVSIISVVALVGVHFEVPERSEAIVEFLRDHEGELRATLPWLDNWWEDLAIPAAMISVVIFIASIFLSWFALYRRNILLFLVSLIPLIASLPGTLIVLAIAIVLGAYILLALIMCGTIYWTLVFFFPQLGVFIHRTASSLLKENYQSWVLTALAGIPFVLGAGVLFFVGVKSHWSARNDGTLTVDALSESSTRWLTWQELRSYYKPVAEVTVTAVSIVVVSKVIFDTFG